MRTALNPTFYWEGKMPALVIALRPLKISDGHVLEWLANFAATYTCNRKYMLH